jgi:hypothetical protein
VKHLILIIAFAVAAATANAATVQEHKACTGEFESRCKALFGQDVEFRGCASTEKDAVCYQFCGQPETPSTCSQTRLGNVISEGKCGYGAVTVRCYK